MRCWLCVVKHIFQPQYYSTQESVRPDILSFTLWYKEQAVMCLWQRMWRSEWAYHHFISPHSTDISTNLWICTCGWSLPLKKLLTLRYPTLRRRTDSLSRRERTSSGNGSRSISLSSSPFSRSRWRFDGLDLTTALPSLTFFLRNYKKKIWLVISWQNMNEPG